MCNVARVEIWEKLEIALDKVKLALIRKCDTDLAIEAVYEARDLIPKRKRKIRIADGSKAGWATVEQLDKQGADHLSAEQLHAKQLLIDQIMLTTLSMVYMYLLQTMVKTCQKYA